MWHVIEGPDDVGKTTLARKLEERGWRYEHAGATDTLPTLARRMADLQVFVNVVWDRAHLGEIVHAPLDRGYAPSLGWWRLIEAFLIERGAQATLLRVRPGAPEQWENDDKRQRTLVQLFDQAARNSVLRWEEGDPFLAHRPEAYEPFMKRIDPEGLGAALPEAWILGEQESSKTPVPWPFATRCGIELVWPAVNPSVVRVSNCLSRLPIDRLDATELHHRWQSLGEPPVIALGNHVERWCMTADIPVSTKLPHPQWHLRFHASETHRYVYHLALAILRAQQASSQNVPVLTT